MSAIQQKKYKYQVLLLLLLCSIGEINALNAQTTAPPNITVAAGTQYNSSKGQQRRWGKHYRKEWATPVNFKVVMLDTLAGGVTPYAEGGGRQSKSLRIRDANGREWVLRSIDKTYSKALPEIVRKTFIEHIANDQVSIAHPYSAVTIAPMAEAAKILHTSPQIFYVPKQARLGKYSDEYGDKLYLFEQRPDENWETAPNFANSSNIISTEKLLERLQKHNDERVDQVLYVRSRLFDFVIGDWGRHEDQWRWAATKSGDETLYKPIPRDRDQAYTMFDGFLLRRAKAMAADHLQSFDATIKDINKFNFPARNLDRRMANEVTLQQWLQQANELKALLTDNVIESAIRQMPPEVFPISGEMIISKLKSRRDHLDEYANKYYLFIAKEVDIPASNDNEMIEVSRLSDGATSVNIYPLKKNGEPHKKPAYSRIFYRKETKEIRIYGIDGEDNYQVLGESGGGVKVRLIGGHDKDLYVDSANGRIHKLIVYDNPGNNIAKKMRRHLSKDSSINAYRYDAFTYDKKGIKPLVFYSNEDHVYAGLEYGLTKFRWRKHPFGWQEKLNVKYSITEKAMSFTYDGRFAQALGKWDVNLYANFDQVRWYNYFGLGNESVNFKTDREFNRLRTKEFIGKLGVVRKFGKYNKIGLSGFYQTVQVKNDSAFDKALLPLTDDLFDNKQFGGAQLDYSFLIVNDSLLPTKGFGFAAAASYNRNLHNSNEFMRYTGSIQAYLPLTKTIGIAIRGGGATLTGTPEFYQYNMIGGGPTLRGFYRPRFYGKTTAYDQNELRWIKNVKSYLYSGKFGLLAFYDIGRVWMPGESSNTWHAGYGGAIILAPFNRISVSFGYGISSDSKNLFFRLLKVL